MRTTIQTLAPALILGIGLALPAAPAAAEDLALIIANTEYRRLDDIDVAGGTGGTRDALREAGFDLMQLSDAGTDDMLDALQAFAAGTDGAEDARVVVLIGQFVRAGGSLWLLGADVDGVPDLRGLPRGALPVDLIAATLQRAEGRVALLLGGPAGEAPLERIVEPGLNPRAAPRDLRVPVVAGRADDVLGAAREVLAERGGALTRRELERRDLLGRKVGKNGIAVVSAREARSAPARPAPISADAAERNYWEVVERYDNQTGYDAYLRRFPSGNYAATARARLDAITADPAREAREAEADLNLSQEARRAAQSDLVLLGFDTRGVDGIFGAGSRSAIADWQVRNGYERSGFLTGEQVRILDAQGARRQAELDAERERRRAQAEATDRDYWAQTGADGSADGLRRYLDQFPDGLYAAGAEARLDAMAEEGRARASAQDRRAWSETQGRDRPGAYRRYLRDYSEGAYRDAARQRLRELVGSNEGEGEGDVRRAAAEAEGRLGLDSAGRRLVESGLDRFGLEPGAVDGEFDRETRRALRRYQDERGLPVTGYMTQDMVVRMLAESILR